LQFTHANTLTKNCKRACLFATADSADTKKLNLIKTKKIEMTELKNNLKPFTDKNAQLVTRNIRKPGDVGNLKLCTFTQNCNGLIGWGFENPASAYCHRVRPAWALTIGCKSRAGRGKLYC